MGFAVWAISGLVMVFYSLFVKDLAGMGFAEEIVIFLCVGIIFAPLLGDNIPVA